MYSSTCTNFSIGQQHLCWCYIHAHDICRLIIPSPPAGPSPKGQLKPYPPKPRVKLCHTDVTWTFGHQLRNTNVFFFASFVLIIPVYAFHSMVYIIIRGVRWKMMDLQTRNTCLKRILYLQNIPTTIIPIVYMWKISELF